MQAKGSDFQLVTIFSLQNSILVFPLTVFPCRAAANGYIQVLTRKIVAGTQRLP